jgi:hypothetical protein
MDKPVFWRFPRTLPKIRTLQARDRNLTIPVRRERVKIRGCLKSNQQFIFKICEQCTDKVPFCRPTPMSFTIRIFLFPMQSKIWIWIRSAENFLQRSPVQPTFRFLHGRLSGGPILKFGADVPRNRTVRNMQRAVSKIHKS